MNRRQTDPRQWLILNRLGSAEKEVIRRLARGSGILVIGRPAARQQQQLRSLARWRGLTVAFEDHGEAVRVHDGAELRRALLRRIPLILLSPIHPTASHPDWRPLPRMRAATLARLGGRKLVALGGMDARRYARIKNLGFQAWAGISGFRI